MRKLTIQRLKAQASTATYEGAAAYDFRTTDPLVHLAFTYGSALFADGFYEHEAQQVRSFAQALCAAHRAEAKFPWQYGAWMRDPKRGKGNRIQGSLAPALLDSLLDETGDTEDYVARCLGHRPDDTAAFLTHYQRLDLGRPSRAARRGMARALAGFDEYQLTKYAGADDEVRLCDAILFVGDELAALGDAGRLALEVGRYLHAPTRARDAQAASLPMTAARRHLFRQDKAYALSPEFPEVVRAARVTWEQVLGRFGTNVSALKGASRKVAEARNHAVWQALLGVPGLLPDMAFVRNVRNLSQAGFSVEALVAMARGRRFAELWPHQVYAGSAAVPGAARVFDEVFTRMTARLPAGRHLGIGDASGSMSVKVGGAFSSLTAMDTAFCLTGLMSETSGLGASFSDSTFASYSGGRYLSMVERAGNESALAFAKSPALRKGWGGTQVFGAVVELIEWLMKRRDVRPPDCLWFFSDMQFHPAAQAKLPDWVRKEASRRGLSLALPPLELAVKLYRAVLGPVDVVLWNLAAYGAVPVPADMEGVLLVSGFDANTLATVGRWRSGKLGSGDAPVRVSQRAVLDEIRTF